MNIQSIKTIDAHTAGEPLRIITDGYPHLAGTTILEKRRFAKEKFDELRRFLMLEPRGHADMYGCILTEPERKDSDMGVIFLHNEGYSTMCGHGIIALVTVGLEQKLFEIDDPHREIRIDTPAGLVRATAQWNGNRVGSVSFLNVPSFVLHDQVDIVVDELGTINVTIAFGGAFYAYVDASQLQMKLDAESFGTIVRHAKAIKKAVLQQIDINHPDANQDINFLYGVIFFGPAHNPSNHSRNVCVFADGEVDRSPTGTGVSGRAAILFDRNEIDIGQSITIESILGTTFDVKSVERCKIGDVDGIVPEVTGTAFMTGRHEFVLDQNDHLHDGFMLR